MQDVREHKIRHDRLYKAACWLPVDKVIKRETLRWLGHVARMKKDRLPKIALFGWRKGIDQKTVWYDQRRWLKNILKEAQIPEMDWFRAAQSKGPGGKWEWMIDRAFPKYKMFKYHKEQVNKFQVGYDCTNRLPEPAPKRRRGRWPYKLNRQPGECPVCEVQKDIGSSLEKHYVDKHAVFDPEITTYKPVQCKYCGEYVRAKFKLGEHREKECRAWRIRENREGEQENGWLPTTTPPVGDRPAAWYLYTDGSGPSSTETWRGTPSEGAGWGVGVFKNDQKNNLHDEQSEEPLFKLSGPVITDKNSHLFIGAEEATNNTGELTAIYEGMAWIRGELKDSGDIPIVVKYDSQYAAGMAQGKLKPTSNQALIQNTQKETKEVMKKRVIRWEWVKGHSGENGNWWADKLADEGKQGKIGTHNERWAAPAPPGLTAGSYSGPGNPATKEQWMQEICRKCGKDFQLDGRRCKMHEDNCTWTGVPGLGYPGHMKCRKCGYMTGSGTENSRILRQARTYHENECLGSAEANRTCRGCGYRIEGDLEHPIAGRRAHEVRCKKFKEEGVPEDEVWWSCQCGYKVAKRNGERNKAAHLRRCKGTSIENRTCEWCGYIQDDTMTFVHQSHYKACAERPR